MSEHSMHGYMDVCSKCGASGLELLADRSKPCVPKEERQICTILGLEAATGAELDRYVGQLLPGVGRFSRVMVWDATQSREVPESDAQFRERICAQRLRTGVFYDHVRGAFYERSDEVSNLHKAQERRRTNSPWRGE